MALNTTLQRTTVRYKTTKQGLDINVDVWAPPNFETGTTIYRQPAFIYFHGGGLSVGCSEIWIPEWVFDRFTKRGYLFISADYRLLPGSTGHDIVEDLQDLWAFIASPGLKFVFSGPGGETTFEIDTDAIAVGGSSAGGYCATLAAMHCTSPKPKAILSIYGLGGQIFTSHYLSPKNSHYASSLEFLDIKNYEEFVYPFAKGAVPEVARSPPEYAVGHPLGPAYPANPRMALGGLYFQNGVFLDYLTGRYSPSLSGLLRDECGLAESVGTGCADVLVANEETQRRAAEKINADDRHALFPQFNISSDWPATVFVHGKDDTAVPIGESEHLHRLLLDAGVPSKIYSIEGQEHAFDFGEAPEVKWGEEFEQAIEFVDEHARKR